MRKFNQTEKLAFKQAHPKPPIRGFKIVQSGKTIFESKSAALCHQYIKYNRLTKASVISIR